MSAVAKTQGAAPAVPGGVAHLESVFADLRARKRKALVIYLMAGDPNPAFTLRLVPKLADPGRMS
jgi:tryptophan synthase alpha subunit